MTLTAILKSQDETFQYRFQAMNCQRRSDYKKETIRKKNRKEFQDVCVRWLEIEHEMDQSNPQKRCLPGVFLVL